MVKVKEMPYRQKYAHVVADIERVNNFFVPFVQNHLGDEAVVELRKTTQEAAKPIPDDCSFEEKYEIAYANWVRGAIVVFRLIRERLDEGEMEQFKRADVESLKRENASPALFLLKVVRAISPGSAFSMTAKQTAYQLQWMSPYSVSELNRQRLVLDIPRCKVLDFPDSEDVCLTGCQSIYPTWLAEQFKVRMEANRQGNSCTLTFTPLG